MEIRRDVYLEKLICRKKNGLVKIITGIRRCGKSYLLFELFHRHLIEFGVRADHIIEVALDDFRNRKLRDPDAMFSYIERCVKDSDLYYIILDEVQMLPNFADVLNGLLHMSNVDVYVTGSNSRFLSRDVVTAFRGRGDEIHMLPLSFSEFYSVYDGSVSEAWDEYYHYGGLPLVLSRAEPEEKETYLLSLFQEVYLSDIIERHAIRNLAEFNELLDILASSVGSLTNPLKLSRTFKSVKNKVISDVTIDRYISYLEDAFLVNRVARYDVKGRKYIGSPCKYYFEDVGLRNARLHFRQTEENHIMENVIYNELRFRGFQVDVGMVEHFSRDANGKASKKRYEIDFVASKGNKKFYLQSAFSVPTYEKWVQETNSLRQIPDSFTKIIIVREDRKPRRDENGFLTMGICQFLLDPDILN